MKTSKRLICTVIAMVLAITTVLVSTQTAQAAVSITGKTKTIVYAKTPVGKHGKLKIKGKYIVDKNGNPFRLKGVSSHGINWDVGYPYVNKKALQNLRDEWGVNCFRVAMYTENYNGYTVTSKAEKKKLLETIDLAVKSAKSLGMYVIIDWHILSDGNPNTHKKASKTFFTSMAKKYGSYNNVLFEICNEPNGVSWSTIKKYANYVIPAIRQYSNNIIIVGTPNWCQDVDVAAKSKITGQKNIAYSLHFYAATHKDSYRKKVKTAISKNLPIICTEFSGCDASGNGSIDKSSANAWYSLLKKNKIGTVCWSLSNKNESASLLKSSTKKTYGFTTKNLSTMGKWLIEKYTS